MIARRHGWVALVLALSAGAVALLNTNGTGTTPAALDEQLTADMRTTLERSGPEQHQHAGHGAQQEGEVICGVRVYGHEPRGAGALPEVRTVYGFHLCGVAEPGRPWDVAVKLAGPVILDMTTDPPGIQVVEATADVRFIDRLHEMFPPEYAEVASREALSEAEAAELRRRYDEAAF
ncbi:hypothetical protein AMIS_32640 [Actinoplanes missouriensis 431]|uniref:Uncharacterized protein n=1 Tax=Actinoplanes missouriensis (strain ATCC 14538 / DSM 43046 / CBS 188.64 / JCM 3121 / NBRC 102363 / NCIMB 12654 / NRRL B-3342 / UNCC 431) TaxID=512565 RepID=I0H647_ACTM4|nr:hypothetical protein [Actinoplanes missouriensis]BAL88484.1 hypothetical protein AMIS_32640 [Actinoplanes missouriensis 431]